MSSAPRTLNLTDVMQITVGSLALAFPVAVTEEVWDLSAELSMLRVLVILTGSVVVTSLFVYVVYHHAGRNPDRRDFFARVGAVYGVTFVVCALLLLTIGRLPLADLGLTVKRTILVAFPASFSATVVDSLS